jgi:hypothetical protein
MTDRRSLRALGWCLIVALCCAMAGEHAIGQSAAPDSDLTIQRSLARSSREQIFIMWFQLGLGVLTLGLLYFAVHYARAAATHAYRAAIAGEDAV